MARETERKFLVDKRKWNASSQGIRIAQGYLCTVPDRIVRVRRKGGHGYLTVKGKNEGISREEFEYEIPVRDADAMLRFCEQPIIEKVRYMEMIGGKAWEVDVFEGENEGLVIAEIELGSEEESFELPVWAGREVSQDTRFSNASLVQNPYRNWKGELLGMDGDKTH